MDKGRRDDDAGAELPEDGKDGVLGRDVVCHENRGEDANGAGRQHGK